MNHGSLFSGIGGFDLAAEWMGWNNVFHCEWIPFPRQVLDYHFPNADSYVDICQTDFKKYANTIDVLTGGFPCQPFSSAGKRKGTDDERYLWGEMLRAIQEIKPKFVIGENVFGITNIDGGLVFEQVCLDLENEGYEVQPFVIPACAKNAPHRRDRVFFIATNTERIRLEHTAKGRHLEECGRKVQIERNKFTQSIETNGIDGIATNTSNIGYKCRTKGKSTERKSQSFNEQPERFNELYRTNFQMFPSQPPICGGNDGLPTQLDGITFSKWRKESLKGYGNAVVPQVAYEIFKVIEQLHYDTIS